MQVFTQNEKEITVVICPLMPGETTDLLRSIYPFEVMEYSLPFVCE